MRASQIERELSLTQREAVLFNTLRKKQNVTADELIVALVDQELINPDLDRNALIVAMKYLSAKVCTAGWIIERTSTLGRGKNAEYSMSKKF